MGRRAGKYQGDKRRKERARQKKAEDKRQRRQARRQGLDLEGLPTDPETGWPIDPETGFPIDPAELQAEIEETGDEAEPEGSPDPDTENSAV